MGRMFAPALIACVRDGRSPTSAELAEIAQKIRRDVQGSARTCAWDSLPEASDERQRFLSLTAKVIGNADGPFARLAA